MDNLEMDRHFLVTVSEDASMLYGIRFISGFFIDKARIKVTLFFTAPQPSAVWENELNYESLHQMEAQSSKIEQKGQKALNKASAKLIQQGFLKENIQSKLMFRKNSKVSDIIQEAERGNYDAVVLGRRGLSRLEEALLDSSVSKGMMCEMVTIPMWICREPETTRQNILVCVDGTEHCYRMVDHVGFIVALENKQNITVFYLNSGRKKGKSDEILQKSVDILQENGVQADLIQTKVLSSSNISQAIMEEAEAGEYAVIAMGRSGQKGCSIRDIFLESVSYDLFRKVTKSVLWISR